MPARQSRVVGWSPVPKARPGSRARTTSPGARRWRRHVGRMTMPRPTRRTGKWAFQASAQSVSCTMRTCRSPIGRSPNAWRCPSAVRAPAIASLRAAPLPAGTYARTTAGPDGSTAARRPSSRSVNVGSTLVPLGANRPRTSLTASTASGTRLALARETNLVALVDACRNRDPQRPRLFDSTLAMTGLAGALDDPAFAPAARTGGDVDHLAEHRLAYRPDLAPALALRAGGRRGAGLGPRPATGRTSIQDRELDLLLGPRHGFLECDPEVVAQIASGGRPSVSGAAGRCPTEERVEDVAEAGEAGAEARVRAAAHARSAEHVVRLASLGIRQDLVRLVDLLEPDVRLGILADVGMPLLRQPAEGALDVGVGRTPHHAQDLVVVALRHHAGKSTYRALQRRPSYVPASSRARARTSRSISAVRRPVNVFCWLGWYEPTSRYGPTWASAPCPNAGRGRAGWPRVARARRAASQPNRPSGTMTDTSSRIASSRARYGAQLSRSSMVGLLAGGAQRTAAARYASLSARPSFARRL